MKDKENQFLDDLLDSGLRHLGKVEPPLGLESRVIARLHQRAKRWSFAVWRWAGLSLAGVMISAAIFFSQYSDWRSHLVRSGGAITPPKTEHLAKSPMTDSQGTIFARALRDVQRKTPPLRSAKEKQVALRREVFPIPAPLTEQERLLLAYPDLAAERLKQSEALSQEVVLPELQIAEIVVPEIKLDPLEKDELEPGPGQN